MTMTMMAATEAVMTEAVAVFWFQFFYLFVAKLFKEYEYNRRIQSP